MSPPILYLDYVSPPCHSVLIAATVLGVELELRELNLIKQECLNEEFLKMNPQHTLPTLNNNGFIFWDSHAIVCYLSDKYGKDDSLYPKDLQKRTLINQRLFFNSSILLAGVTNMAYEIYGKGIKKITDDMKATVAKMYSFLEKFLQGHNWVVGNSYTVADLCCAPSIIAMASWFVSLHGYPNISAWLERCKQEYQVSRRCTRRWRDRENLVFCETLQTLMKTS